MRKNLVIIITIFIAITSITAYAASLSWTNTIVYFNVAVLREVQVFILAGSYVNVSTSGAMTTYNMEFNSSGNEQTWLNATATDAGHTTQGTGTNSILAIQNIGSVPAVINVSLNNTLPACIRLKYANNTLTYPPSAADLANSSSNLNLTLANITNDGTILHLWLFANFTSCPVGGGTVRNFTVWADYSQ